MSHDLEGVFLAVVATSSPFVNELIFTEARKRGVLCNVVDAPELCDFFYPAVVKRGIFKLRFQLRGKVRSLRNGSEYRWKSNLGTRWSMPSR